MSVFLSILLVSTLALLASSRAWYRLRRWRPTAALISGGWIAMALGFALGPQALGAISDETVRAATPLVVIALGWVGFMIGLQAQRGLLASLPRPVVRAAWIDAALTAVVFGAIAWFGLDLWTGQGAVWARIEPAALIVAASLGWTMETRSQQVGATALAERAAMAVRGGGGLAAMAAIALFGIIFGFVHPEAGRTGGSVALLGGIRLFAAVALAVVVGSLGRFALTLAGKDRSQALAVFLGLVALVAGVSFDLELAPLFVSACAGAVIANLAGSELRSFERFILKAEHVIAALFALLAGVLLTPAIGAGGLALAVTLAGARLIFKPAALRLALGARDHADGTILTLAPARQSPVAIALGVSLVVAADTLFSRQLLTVIVLAGLLSEMLPLAVGFALSGKPMLTPVKRGESDETKAAGAREAAS